jgi:hypothetical protein
MRSTFVLLISLILALGSAAAFGKPGGVYPQGLNPQAEQELKDANVDKYVGQFAPAVSFPVGEGWIKHTFDPGAAFDGPLCVAGTPYSVFTKQGNPAKLLIMLQGGGACWQDFYNCNVLSEDQEPPPPQVGIWDEVSGLNPLDDWSIVYLPYCDGSVFSGDNDIFDPAWQAFIEGALGLEPGTGPIVRFHVMRPQASTSPNRCSRTPAASWLPDPAPAALAQPRLRRSSRAWLSATTRSSWSSTTPVRLP